MRLTKDIIPELHRQIRLKNSHRFAEIMGELITSEPSRWLRLLFDNSLIPEPYLKAENKDFQKRYAFLANVTEVACANGVLHKDACKEVQSILETAVQIRTRLESIASKLGQIPLTKESPATQFYFMGGALERQMTTLAELIVKKSTEDGEVDYSSAIVANIPSNEGNPNYSVMGLYEGMADAVELAIRNILHQSKNAPSHLDLKINKIYVSQALEILKLAGLWNELEALWANTRYAEWRPEKQEENRIVYAPYDLGQIAEVTANRTRETRYIAGLSEPSLLFARDHAALIKKVANNIRVDPKTLIWDGRADTKTLKEAMQLSPFLYTADAVIEARYYGPFIEKIRIDAYPDTAGWREFLTVMNCVRDLSQAMSLSASMARKSAESADWFPPIFVANLDDIIHVCSYVTQLTKSMCQAIVERFVFDPKSKVLDIWDQPLLPVAEGKVMIIPSLVEGGHPRGLIEDFLLQNEGADVFDLRNEPFEKRIAEIMEQGDGAKAAINIKFLASDKNNVEFDVIVWWEGFLILLEAKCQRSAYNSADDYRILRKVEHSVEQLVRRRNLITSDWDKIRNEAERKNSSMLLPEKPPTADKVICISVTNSFRYTAMQKDGVVVTDDICLNRFFDDPRIPFSITKGQTVVQVEAGRIRREEKPSANELFDYLVNPMQISLIRQDIKTGTYKMRALETEPPLEYVTGRYVGSNRNMMATLLPNSSTFIKEVHELVDNIDEQLVG